MPDRPATALWFSSQPGFQAMLLAVLLAAITPPATAQNPDFSLPGLDGRPIRLTDFRGRWVIVNFWASWCSPCLFEMPELQAFHETHSDRATVIGINFEDLPPDKVRAFAQRLVITFPIALSGGNPVTGFDLKGLPTTFLISPAGKLVDTHLGTVNATMLAERIAEMEKTSNSTR